MANPNQTKYHSRCYLKWILMLFVLNMDITTFEKFLKNNILILRREFINIIIFSYFPNKMNSPKSQYHPSRSYL